MKNKVIINLSSHKIAIELYPATKKKTSDIVER